MPDQFPRDRSALIRSLLPFVVPVLFLFFPESPNLSRTILEAEEVGRALRAGSLPTWNANVGLGGPLAATTDCGAWYPLHFLWAIEGFELRWTALLALGWLGMGTVRLLTPRMTGPRAAVMVFVWIQLLGAWQISAARYDVLESVCWLPWILLSIEGLFERRRGAGTSTVLTCGSALLAGSLTVGAVSVLGAALYAVVRVVRRSETALGLRIMFFLVLGALSASVRLVPFVEAMRLAEPSNGPTRAENFLSRALGPEREAWNERLEEARGDGRLVRVGPVLSQLGADHPGELTADMDWPLAHTVELLRAADPAGALGDRATLASVDALFSPVLDLARVSAVISETEIVDDRLERVAIHPFVYRRAILFPKVSVVSHAIPCASDEVVLGLLAATPRSSEHDPVYRVRASAEEAAEVPPRDFAPGTLVSRRDSPTRWDVQLSGSSGGWLVFREAWMPHWKCNINGRDTVVERVDHAFRAVRIPTGDALVRTWYEPWSLRIGTMLTILSLGTCLLAGRGMRKRDAAPARD